MTIPNPYSVVNYEMHFSETSIYIKNVITSFPNSYKVIDETASSIKVLILSKYKDKGFDDEGDIILSAVNDNGNAVKYEVTNQNNDITSYTEAERDKYALGIFIKLMDKALTGTLEQSISNISKPKVDSGKALMQLIILIIAVIAIVFGMKGLFM